MVDWQLNTSLQKQFAHNQDKKKKIENDNVKTIYFNTK